MGAGEQPTTLQMTKNTKTNEKPAVAAILAPSAVELPKASIVASPAKGRTTTMAGAVGGTYGVACTIAAEAGTGAAGEARTVVLPFQLPSWAGKEGAPITVVVASTAPNWLGRNGQPLHVAVYESEMGTVTVQPHSRGVQVNAYPNLPGRHEPITVTKMAPVVQPSLKEAAPIPAAE